MMPVALASPPFHFGLGEWVFFLLANGIIIYICIGKLLVDVRRWVRRGTVETARFEEGQGGG